MAQRIALLLAAASMLVIVCSAQGPTMEPASAQKYEKKGHYKHEHEKYDKPDKHDKDYKPDSYKPDSYKPDSYKPDGYKPDGYKPDGYKRSAYKHDEYNHNKHHKYSRGEYKESYGISGYNGYDDEYDGYSNHGPSDYDYTTPDGTPGNTPHMYDSGYYGGNNGLNTLRLDVLLPENLLNTTLIGDNGLPPVGNPNPCIANNLPNGCAVDFGLICGLRRSNPYGSYVHEKSYEEKFAPLIQSITKPLLIGRGYANNYINWATLQAAMIDDTNTGFLNIKPNGLVIVNGDQRAYIVGQIQGEMVFEADAEDCHPTLNGDTKIEYDVPVYAMVAQIALPADPSAYINLKTPRQKVSIASAREDSYDKKDHGSDVSNTLCGIALVARGPVKLTTKVGTTSVVYTGTMELVKGWTDTITTVPRLNEEEETTTRRGASAPFLDTAAKRLDAVCKTNDIPFAHVGSLRLDVTRTST